MNDNTQVDKCCSLLFQEVDHLNLAKACQIRTKLFFRKVIEILDTTDIHVSGRSVVDRLHQRRGDRGFFFSPSYSESTTSQLKTLLDRGRVEYGSGATFHKRHELATNEHRTYEELKGREGPTAQFLAGR